MFMASCVRRFEIEVPHLPEVCDFPVFIAMKIGNSTARQYLMHRSKFILPSFERPHLNGGQEVPIKYAARSPGSARYSLEAIFMGRNQMVTCVNYMLSFQG